MMAVPALGVERGVASRRDHNILASVDRIGRWRRVDASAGLKLPEHGAVSGVIRLEPAVGFAREHQTTRGREHAADHGFGGLDAPRDLAACHSRPP